MRQAKILIILCLAGIFCICLAMTAACGCDDEGGGKIGDSTPAGDEDENDEDVYDENAADDDEADTLDCNGYTCTDSRTGLIWQQNSDCCYEWADALSYCEDLTCNGYKDWRLPSISELRSLVRGCDNTDADGTCRLTDTCLTPSCLDDFCGGCTMGAGPNDGCYWPEYMNGTCDRHWSYSEIVSDYECGMFVVHFNNAKIRNYDAFFNKYSVRCVR